MIPNNNNRTNQRAIDSVSVSTDEISIDEIFLATDSYIF